MFIGNGTTSRPQGILLESAFVSSHTVPELNMRIITIAVVAATAAGSAQSGIQNAKCPDLITDEWDSALKTKAQVLIAESEASPLICDFVKGVHAEWNKADGSGMEDTEKQKYLLAFLAPDSAFEEVGDYQLAVRLGWFARRLRAPVVMEADRKSLLSDLISLVNRIGTSGQDGFSANLVVLRSKWEEWNKGSAKVLAHPPKSILASMNVLNWLKKKVKLTFYPLYVLAAIIQPLGREGSRRIPLPEKVDIMSVATEYFSSIEDNSWAKKLIENKNLFKALVAADTSASLGSRDGRNYIIDPVILAATMHAPGDLYVQFVANPGLTDVPQKKRFSIRKQRSALEEAAIHAGESARLASDADFVCRDWRCARGYIVDAFEALSRAQRIILNWDNRSEWKVQSVNQSPPPPPVTKGSIAVSLVTNLGKATFALALIAAGTAAAMAFMLYFFIPVVR